MPIPGFQGTPGTNEMAARQRMKLQPRNASEQLSGAISGKRKKNFRRKLSLLLKSRRKQVR
jgi:hypothetical protein